MKTKNVIIFIVVFAVLGGAYFFWNKKLESPIVQNEDKATENINSQSNQTDTQKESTNTVKPVAISPTRDIVWKVLQDYLLAAKSHDIEKLKKLSYQQSATCADPNQKDACFALMDGVYNMGSAAKKEDYVNVYEDKSQVILTTNTQKIFEGDLNGYEKGYFLFARDEYTGSLKVLYFNTARGWYYTKQSGETIESIDKKLQILMKDSDNDYLTDEQESCTGSFKDDPKCTNTNPNKKDSDSDGWWDGVEYFFYKDKVGT